MRDRTKVPRYFTRGVVTNHRSKDAPGLARVHRLTEVRVGEGWLFLRVPPSPLWIHVGRFSVCALEKRLDLQVYIQV